MLTMFNVRVVAYIVATVITIASSTSTNLEEYRAAPSESKVVETTGKLRESKETGFDVGFDELPSDKESDHAQEWPGQHALPGFDGNRPGFSNSETGGHSSRPGYGQGGFGHDTSVGYRPFNDNRLGYAESGLSGFYPGFGSNRPGFGSVPVYPSFESTNQGSTGSYDVGFDATRPGFAKGHDGTNPWFNHRDPRQINYNRGQTVHPGFDSGFDGTRRGPFDAGFDGTRPGFSQNSRPPIDFGFDGTRPGFTRRYPRQINSGQKVSPGFDIGFDGTRPGFSQNSSPTSDAGFDGTRPAFSQSFDKGFDGARPGFSQQPTPIYDAGFDGTRPGFSQNQQTPLDGGFDDTRPGFFQRPPRDLSLEQSNGSEADFDLVQDNQGQLEKSQKFFYLQPSPGNNWNKWNNQPQPGSYPFYGQYGPHGPMGIPQGGPRPGYWNR